MGQTVIEKIISRNLGREVKPGDIVTVNVDRVMIHDIFIPFVAEKFEEMGFQTNLENRKIFGKESVLYIAICRNRYL